MPKGPQGQKRPTDVIGNAVHVKERVWGRLLGSQSRSFTKLIISVVLCSGLSACGQQASISVTSTEYGESWPFPNYTSGTISCQDDVVTIRLGDRDYALNGKAANQGYMEAGEITYIPVGPSAYRNALVDMLSKGASLCAGRTTPTVAEQQPAPTHVAPRQSDLHNAASRGDEVVLARLLKQGRDPNITASNEDGFRSGLTPLHLAKTRAIAALLISAGAKIEARDSEGETPLHYAASRADVDTCLFLITAGANVNAKDSIGSTPLLKVLANWELTTARTLAKQQIARTIMHDLVEHGANVNTQDSGGNFPLYEAELTLDAADLAYLLNHDADINMSSSEDGYTVLHAAVADEQVDMVRLLVERGARTDVRDHDGQTATEIAVSNHESMQSDLRLVAIVSILSQH